MNKTFNNATIQSIKQTRETICKEVIVQPSNILLFHFNQYHICAQLVITIKSISPKKSFKNLSRVSPINGYGKYFYQLKTTNRSAFKVSQTKGILNQTPFIIKVYIKTKKDLDKILKQSFKLQVTDISQRNTQPVAWKFKIAIEDNTRSSVIQSRVNNDGIISSFLQKQNQSSFSNKNTNSTLYENASSISKGSQILAKTLDRKFGNTLLIQNKQKLQFLKNNQQIKEIIQARYEKSYINRYKDIQSPFKLNSTISRNINININHNYNHQNKNFYQRNCLKNQMKDKFIHTIQQLNIKKSKLERLTQTRKNTQTKKRFKIYLAILIFFVFMILGFTVKKIKNSYFDFKSIQNIKTTRYSFF